MTPPIILETSILAARRIRVLFERVNDRVGHYIQLIREDVVPLTILQSVEGTPSEHNPPSPTLQQLHVEERGRDSRVALLVGMAGKHHWSLSVETEPTGDLVFDVACRVGGTAQVLGSTYQLLAGRDVKLASDGKQLDGPGWGISAIATGQEEPASLECSGDTLCIKPVGISGRTVRWKYRVGLRKVLGGRC